MFDMFDMPYINKPKIKPQGTEPAMNTGTYTIVHTVHGQHTLCGKYTPAKNTVTKKKVGALAAPWVTCPICTLAATCHELDTTRSQMNGHRARRHMRWIQPTLFDNQQQGEHHE